MVAHTNASAHPTVVCDGDAHLWWVPSTPVLIEVAQRVRMRLAAEAEASQHVFVSHSASIPDDA